MERRSFFKSLFGIPVTVPSILKGENDDGRKVPIQEIWIAGFQYYKGEEIWNTMSPGDMLELVRESDNYYDDQAVEVFFKGSKLGYLPRHDNSIAAKMMDNGESLVGKILELKESGHPGNRIRIEILLAAN